MGRRGGTDAVWSSELESRWYWCLWVATLTNHFPLEPPDIFRRGRKREGEWACGWRLGEGGDGDEH
ncbi:hypothetical protein FH972_026957 [Carpinus fangiana]|uniref:Uncharacterized protein n=1 Tax=Carpinus fangiana TaxID=176857 RepID=A0A5N6L813_9ROSI|nr:hypothetical protein FH972_026957 [Carpinus fangiana]